MHSPLILTTALAAAFSTAVAADPVNGTTDTFSGADTIVIREFVGTVVLKEGRQMRVEVSDAKEGGPLSVSDDNRAAIVAGEAGTVKALYRRGSPAKKMGRRGDSRDRFAEFLDDYPTLTVTLPEGASVQINTAALMIDGDMLLGTVSIDNAYEVYGELGDSAKASIGIDGSGELVLGRVAGMFAADIDGSGDVSATEAGEAVITIDGSGDVDVGNVAANVAIEIDGSGDVTVGSAGQTDIMIDGSGDVQTGRVVGALTVAIDGSGDVEVADVAGDLRVSINGSGDIDVGRGRASMAQISINGAGDVDFGGVAVNPMVRISGSGGVRISDYEGEVDVRGDKDDVRIGDLRFDNDR